MKMSWVIKGFKSISDLCREISKKKEKTVNFYNKNVYYNLYEYR